MPIVSRGQAAIERAARNLWFLFIPVVAGAAVVGSIVAVGANSASKTDLKQFARHQAQLINAKSRQRSIDNCNRSNPGRAYLLLRAREITSSTSQEAANYVYGILDCEKVVDTHGQPIPVVPAVADQYLKMFSKCRVPELRRGRIVGSQSFDAYFHRRGHCRRG